MHTVGIVGAGQLARMMAQAAIPLDVHLVVLADREDDSAAQVIRSVVVGAPNDLEAMRSLASQTDVVTFDHELVDINVLRTLEDEGVIVAPSSATMTLAQDKRLQRQQLSEAGFPAPQFLVPDNLESAESFAASVGYPVIVKAAKGGYDGRGVWTVGDPDGLRVLWNDLIERGVPPLLEERVPLDSELAVLVARSRSGEVVTYPAVETVQRDGICNELRVPAPVDIQLQQEASQIAEAIASHIGMIGIMAIEFFVSNRTLLVNEIAPRPHNSGHWTINGARTSQFEQHLRAVLGLPLGSTDLVAPHVCTVNVLGAAEATSPESQLSQALQDHDLHVHLYGKQPRPGRKLGHVTITGSDRNAIHARAWHAANILSGKDRQE